MQPVPLTDAVRWVRLSRSRSRPVGPAAAQQYSPHSGSPQGAYGGTPTTGGLECRVCGAGPAVKATFVGVTGFAVAWTVRRWCGPYCRTCGLATFREAVSEKLVGGWWLIVGFVVVPGYVLANLFGRSRVSGLGGAVGSTIAACRAWSAGSRVPEGPDGCGPRDAVGVVLRLREMEAPGRLSFSSGIQVYIQGPPCPASARHAGSEACCRSSRRSNALTGGGGRNRG
jgi:hypothetical protein